MNFPSFTLLQAVVGLRLLMPIASPAQPVAISPGYFNPENGHVYFLLGTADWTDSEAAAVALGGSLATVRNLNEDDFIFNTFADYGGVDRFLWIGLNDAAMPGTYVWASGESVTFLNWAVDEPDNLNGAEFWAEMYPANVARGPGYPPAGPGTWNDVPNSSYPYQGNTSGNNFGPVYGVVEIAPEPTPLALVVVAAGVLLSARAVRLAGRKSRLD